MTALSLAPDTGKTYVAEFEGWQIRYKIQSSFDDQVIGLDADAWQPGTPISEDKTFNIWVKWDGCSHLRCPYLHFDTDQEFEAFSRAVNWIRDDLCDSVGMID